MQTATSFHELTRDFLAAYGAHLSPAQLPAESYEWLTEWLRNLHGTDRRAEDFVAEARTGESVLMVIRREMENAFRHAVVDARNEAREVAAASHLE